MEENLLKQIEVYRAACLIIIKGRVYAAGMRHFAFEKGQKTGICGYMNYQCSGSELHIHAEAENEELLDYIAWINDFCKSNHLVVELKQADCQGFNSLVIAIPEKSTDVAEVNQNTSPEQNNECLDKANAGLKTGYPVILALKERIRQDYAFIVNKLKNVSLW